MHKLRILPVTLAGSCNNTSWQTKKYNVLPMDIL
jgi:hypothetical protein